MLISELNSVNQIFSTAFGLLKKLKDHETENELRDTINRLHDRFQSLSSKLIECESSKSSALERVKELSARKKEMSNYQLAELAPGHFVYKKVRNLKVNEEKPHYCPNCLDNNLIISILQPLPQKRGEKLTKYRCHICKLFVFGPPPGS